MFVCLTGVASPQIVAPAGRTLFNRAVMFRIKTDLTHERNT